MAEKTFEIRVPAPLLEYGLDEDDIQACVSEWLVLKLFTEGQISSGKAARLLDMNRVAFLRLLGARGIPFTDYTPDELADEFSAARELSQAAP